MSSTCQTCGMQLHDAGEFHPPIFCVLYGSYCDPWDEVRLLVAQLSLGDLPERPPLITETHRV